MHGPMNVKKGFDIINMHSATVKIFVSFVYYMSAIKKTQEGVRQEATKQMALR